MNKFKLGDKVRIIQALDHSGKVIRKGAMPNIDKVMGTIQTITSVGEGNYPYLLSGVQCGHWQDAELEAVGKKAKNSFPMFLLSKGANENPIELNSEAEARKEIKKIASDSESYDKSFKVYAIKAVKTVLLEDTVIIKGLN